MGPGSEVWSWDLKGGLSDPKPWVPTSALYASLLSKTDWEPHLLWGRGDNRCAVLGTARAQPPQSQSRYSSGYSRPGLPS